MSKYNDNAHPTQVAYADGIKYGLELEEEISHLIPELKEKIVLF